MPSNQVSHQPHGIDVHHLSLSTFPDSPLTHQALPLFEHLMHALISTAPNEPNLKDIDQTLRDMKNLSTFIIQGIDSWTEPLYDHNIGCYIQFLYPGTNMNALAATNNPNTNEEETAKVLSNLTVRDKIMLLLQQHGFHQCQNHQDCVYITILHSLLTFIQCSPLLSSSIPVNAFTTVSEKFINYFDTQDDVSPLMLAVGNRYSPAPLRAILAHPKLHINTPSKSGKFIMQFATQQPPTQLTNTIVQLLIQRKSMVYYPEEQNPHFQPLSLAINIRSDLVGELLVFNNYPVDAMFSLNQTCLQAAISQHMTSTASALISLNAHKNPKQTDSQGNTILHYAALYNNVCLVQKLLDMKAYRVNVKNTMQQTPLVAMVHQEVSHPAIIRCLLENGENPNRVNNKNIPLICQGLVRHHYDQIRAILTFTADEKKRLDAKNALKMKKADTPAIQTSKKSVKNHVISKSEGKNNNVGWFRSLFSPVLSPQTSPRSPSSKISASDDDDDGEFALILPDVNQHCPRQIYHGSPFFYACVAAPQDIVEVMIRYHHAALTTKNENKQTVIHLAIQRNEDIMFQQQIHFEQQQAYINSKLFSTLNHNFTDLATPTGTPLVISPLSSPRNTPGSREDIQQRLSAAQSFHVHSATFNPLHTLFPLKVSTESVKAIPEFECTRLDSVPASPQKTCTFGEPSLSESNRTSRGGSFYQQQLQTQQQQQARASFNLDDLAKLTQSAPIQQKSASIGAGNTPTLQRNASSSNTARSSSSTLISNRSSTNSIDTGNVHSAEILVPEGDDDNVGALIKDIDVNRLHKFVCVNWNDIAHEDEDVIFLGRMLATLHYYFQNTHDPEFEVV